jgi:hypothetical protein
MHHTPACLLSSPSKSNSPLLFILAIDPLQRIIEAAAQKGVLKPILPKAANLRCSLYADDAAFFAYPEPRDENGTDIFRPYSRPNPFRGVLIRPYPSPDI